MAASAHGSARAERRRVIAGKVDQDWQNRTRPKGALEDEKTRRENKRGASIHWLAGENPLARPAEAMASDQARCPLPPIK